MSYDRPDTDVDPETEERIAHYTAELRAEAQLAREDIAELEDHLRCVAAELRDRGMPAAVAVTEAAHRLGDPREIAREHARVASPFGERLTKQRAWSAAAIVAPFSVYAIVRAVGAPSVPGIFECVLSVVLVGALALRMSWARALMFGSLATVVFANMLQNTDDAFTPNTFLNNQVLAYLGATALLWPRRAGEITAAGWGLALISVAYGGAAAFAGLRIGDSGGLAVLMFGAVALGTAGGIVRARWGAVAMAASAALLVVGIRQMWSVEVDAWWLAQRRNFASELVGIGIMAAMAAATLSWRSARSTLGTLRGVIA